MRNELSKSDNYKLGVSVVGVPDSDYALSEAGYLSDFEVTAKQTDLGRRMTEIKSVLQNEDFDDIVRSYLIGALGELKTLKALLNLEGN